MKMPYHTLINLDVYGTAIYLLVGGDQKGIEKWKQRELAGYDMSVGNTKSDLGAFWTTKNKKTGHTAYVLWIQPMRRNNESVADIAHEALHATIGILRHKGIRLAHASEESYAYLLDHVLKRILDTMDKKKLWQR